MEEVVKLLGDEMVLNLMTGWSRSTILTSAISWHSSISLTSSLCLSMTSLRSIDRERMTFASLLSDSLVRIKSLAMSREPRMQVAVVLIRSVA
jgi:hypothetical protein